MWGFLFLVVLAACALVVANASLQSDFVDAHNRARAAEGVGGLRWDNNLAAFAERYVVTLRDRHNCGLVHSGGPYGENLYWWSGTGVAPPTPANAVQSWVNEKQFYNYASNTCAPNKVCGHYTQVVWRNSVRLGCAYFKCRSNVVIVSCNYDPPGNFAGQPPFLRANHTSTTDDADESDDGGLAVA